MAKKDITGEEIKQKITHSQFKGEMKNLKPGVFLFYGDENFIKLHTLQDIRSRVCEDDSFEAFNHFVFTRDNYSAEAVHTAALSIPMMNDYKLIELYEIPLGDMRKKEDIEALLDALEAASDSDDTILIIYTTAENFDEGDERRPSEMYKALAKYATPVEFAHEPTQKIVLWVQKHFSAERIVAELPECTHLIDTVGHDLTTLSGEIEKLTAYLHYKERDKLHKMDIDLVCPHNKEIGAFEFADAILDGNNDKAFYILADYKLKNEPAQIILGGIIKCYTDLLALKIYAEAGVSSDDAAKRTGMHKYVAKMRMAKAKACERAALEGIIKLCSETDEALKSSAVEQYILLERLIVGASQYRKRKVF